MKGTVRWRHSTFAKFLWDALPSSAKPPWSNSWSLPGDMMRRCITASMSWKKIAGRLSGSACDGCLGFVSLITLARICQLELLTESMAGFQVAGGAMGGGGGVPG